MDREICGQCGNPTAFFDSPLTRDDIMHLVNETAPRYQSWGIEAHFQNFAKSLSAIVAAHERARCLRVCREVAQEAQEMGDRNGASSAAACGAAIWGLE